MKKITIIAAMLLFSVPVWSIDSKEMDEIIKSILESGSYVEEKKPDAGEMKTAAQPVKNEIPGNSDPSGNSNPVANISLSPLPDESLIKSGIQLYESGFYENAKKNFEKLRNEFPESSYRDLSSIWLSKLYLKENDTEGAINILKTIGSDSGEFPLSLSMLGKIYMQAGDNAKAIEYLYRISSSFPEHELADDSLIEIANLYINNNKGNQAIEAAIKIIKNYKERETLDDAYFTIAMVFEKDPVLRDFSIARKIYRIFIKRATIDNNPVFKNSPLLEKVESNLRNINNVYYGRIVNN